MTLPNRSGVRCFLHDSSRVGDSREIEGLEAKLEREGEAVAILRSCLGRCCCCGILDKSGRARGQKWRTNKNAALGPHVTYLRKLATFPM
ncbi:hypothetical protein V6N12_074557 [Hibiscus sabdariffa]|uniref:Uncharacterized protein n=1 Tax=Hibiscus sabdariffa TaxID=183260 RepID=A0ABR2B2E7_9ROSI